MKTIKEKEASDPKALIREEYLEGFLRWSHQQTVPLLPKVSEDQPLMRTRITLRKVPLSSITATIASCLQHLREKSVLCSFRPHPEHAGRIEIRSVSCKLKFVVQLYRDTEDTEAVVVELQKRRGCCVFMHHLRRSLFKALSELCNEDEVVLPPITTTAVTPRTDQQIDLGPLPRAISFERPLTFPPPLRLNFA